jgi:hypothetical protein
LLLIIGFSSLLIIGFSSLLIICSSSLLIIGSSSWLIINFSSWLIIFLLSFSEFNEFLEDTNVKADYTIMKFDIEIKNYDGIIKKKNNHSFEYYINMILLKDFLINKYNIEFF